MPLNIERRTINSDIELPDAIHPVLRRVYAARDIRSADELDYSLKSLLPFDGLKGIDAATELLAKAIEKTLRLLIVADFDADGATSCALAMRGLAAMGARDVCYVVPNRFEYGYGLSPEIVEVAAGYSPDVLITVDNGISSVEGVTLAREKGMQVLITDHHLPGDKLPPADAIVNPNQAGDSFASKSLAGVGVMFYILVALRSHLRDTGWFDGRGIPEPNLAELLDLVALGTVADVVPLDHNNRILVAQGLARIRNGRCCPGITALLKFANRSMPAATAQDLAFAVAPRLNAAGRLTDMSLGIECLLSDEERNAAGMARQLDDLNRERREIQQEMHVQALADMGELDLDTDNPPAGVCLFNADWHQGVIGILASKIKDKLNRPVIVFAPGGENTIKGSARSINGVHIRDVLDTIASRHPGVIEKFGGHAMAAGLSLNAGNYDRFATLFNETIDYLLGENRPDDTVFSDGELAPEEIDFRLASTIVEAGPWGQGFPEPVFDGEFDIVSRRIVGQNHLKLQLQCKGHDRKLDAIAFNVTDEGWPASTTTVKTIYKLDISEYAGQRRLQLVVDYIVPS